MITAHPTDFSQGQFYFGNSRVSGADWIPLQIPPGAKFLDALLVGCGGNGGAGASAAAGTQRGGGGGGGGGALASFRLPCAFLPSTVYLSLAGRGAGVTSYLSAFPDTSSYYYSCNAGGTGGTGTTTAAGAGGGTSSINVGPALVQAFVATIANGVSGGAGSLGDALGSTIIGSKGIIQGGAGGSGVTLTSQFGGFCTSNYGRASPQSYVAGPGNPGIDGFRIMAPYPIFTGACAGGSNNTGTGGNGGNGGPGCGGGGGGAGVTGGSGGTGGEGFAWVMFS